VFRFRPTSVSGFPRMWLNIRIPCARGRLAPCPTGRAVFPHPAVPHALASRHLRVVNRSELDDLQSLIDEVVPAHPSRWLEGPLTATLQGTPHAKLHVGVDRADLLGLFSQLPSQTGELRRQTLPRIVRTWRLSSVGRRVFRSGKWSVHLQAVLPSSYISMHMVGPLRSTGITRRRHYYEPRRFPIEAARPLMDSRPALSSPAPPIRRATGRRELLAIEKKWRDELT